VKKALLHVDLRHDCTVVVVLAVVEGLLLLLLVPESWQGIVVLGSLTEVPLLKVASSGG
jgi:hypothetical protein